MFPDPVINGFTCPGSIVAGNTITLNGILGLRGHHGELEQHEHGHAAQFRVRGGTGAGVHPYPDGRGLTASWR